ncbi:hypothetical protein ACRE_076840 [Hapsidospora chrysogenum ATCC 11550]|uniref:Uncharacterized protein n=1 Tax=Hapsidospora chrysogenum (strain ATCC 11550 / CBS 779.69 / DSM 880 / IAM 14645 / JCM 23072 / IMI 49137) TaxID=857340 RepID=A0A086SWV8_HAPC1|nr:hypothetical protein ACRE_076840 [Hapsidospora chrysogenum ATCC 11550]
MTATALLAGPVMAVQWTVTSYYVVTETTSVWTAFEETYMVTETFGLKSGVTPTAASPISTYTSTDTFDDLKIVELYYDGSDVDESDIMTTTTYDYDYDYSPNTYYVVPIEYTAPSSCATAFTVSTHTVINVPTEVADQVSPTTISTSIYSYDDGDAYTYITAYLPADQVPITVDTTSDWLYTYYVADCRNPVATSRGYFDDDYDDDDDGFSRGSAWRTCMNSSYCSGLAIYAIVLAALIPALFLFGFLESYFWFRRMMIGKFSLRFGTVLWVLLLLPVLCFTRQCPARDAQTQEALRAQWKKVSFGKALGLWFRWGFRHRYPVELLGVHPLYHNPAPGQTGPMPPFPPGPPPPGGYVYYAPGPGPDGQPGFPPGGFPPGPPPTDGFKGAPDMQQMGGPPPGMAPPGMVPPGMVLYYPQYPPQAYAPQNQPPPPAPTSVSPQPSEPSQLVQPSEPSQAPVTPAPPAASHTPELPTVTPQPPGEPGPGPGPEPGSGPSNRP